MKGFYIASINQEKDLYEVMSEFRIFNSPNDASDFLKHCPEVEEDSEGFFRCRYNTDRVFVILPLHQRVLDRYFEKLEYLVVYYESRAPHAKATRVQSRLPLDNDDTFHKYLREKLNAAEILSVILLDDEINELDLDEIDDNR